MYICTHTYTLAIQTNTRVCTLSFPSRALSLSHTKRHRNVIHARNISLSKHSNISNIYSHTHTHTHTQKRKPGKKHLGPRGRHLTPRGPILVQVRLHGGNARKRRGRAPNFRQMDAVGARGSTKKSKLRAPNFAQVDGCSCSQKQNTDNLKM
jgi:hypothetical protein